MRLAKEAVLRAFETPLTEGLAAEKQAFALLAAITAAAAFAAWRMRPTPAL